MKNLHTIGGWNDLERRIKFRRRVKAAVLIFLGVNIAALLMFLVQGCREEESSPALESTETNQPSIGEATNSLAVSTNLPAANVSPVPLAQTNFQPAAASDASEPGANEYTIARGDTFSGLAKRFHVPVKAIVEANQGVDPARLHIGQKIQMPQFSNAVAAATSDTDDANVYVVKPGDTLIKVAHLFGTTPKAIREENNLTTNRINAGQTLKIPARPAAASQSAAGQISGAQ